MLEGFLGLGGVKEVRFIYWRGSKGKVESGGASAESFSRILVFVPVLFGFYLNLDVQ